ncbi:hypothetical protein HDV00_000536 [Rhizophlyctis rosea]|nr:hypothetical protein HDV00_000536 [Rhizophlyctis rosea]
MYRLRGLHLDFVEFVIHRSWFETLMQGITPSKESVIMRVYPQEPLYLPNADHRALILNWFNSFRHFQYKLVDEEVKKNEEEEADEDGGDKA